MKSNVVWITFLFMVGTVSVSAQADSAISKGIYFNSFHSGGLIGKKGNGPSLSATTIHGIRKNKIAFGAGVGYQAYTEWRTLPVFASVGYDFGWDRKKNVLFIQFNAGYSKAWVPETDDNPYEYHSEGGSFFNPSIGYRIHSNQYSLYFVAGYQWQNLIYEQKIKGWDNPSSKVTIQRDSQRISLQLGFGWH